MWDTAKFISNHYRDAAEEIYLLELELREACVQLKLDTDDFIRHIEKERVYLESLKKPPPDVEAKGRYVEALNELRKCRYVTSRTIDLTNSETLNPRMSDKNGMMHVQVSIGHWKGLHQQTH